MKKEDFQSVFERLISVSDRMPTGQREFMRSLHQQYEARGVLSDSQTYHLERLSTTYSMEEITKQDKFEKEYSSEHRLTALRCAWYYDAQFPRYFGNIVDKVLCSPDAHTLNYREFHKMCQNKYAKKIIAAYAAPVKFSVGAMAQVRANNRIDIANTRKKEGYSPKGAGLRHARGKICLVLEVDAMPITRAAAGARIYKILIIDETSPIYAHESDLKTPRRPKKWK